MGLDWQNNNSVRASRFFVLFFTDVKLHNFIFYGGRKQGTTNFFLSKLEHGPQEVNSREFAYI